MEDVPFEVTEAVDIGDLSDLKEDRAIVPPTANVLFRISKASMRKSLVDNQQPESEENPCVLKSLSLEVRLEEGIDEEGKYKNKPLFLSKAVLTPSCCLFVLQRLKGLIVDIYAVSVFHGFPLKMNEPRFLKDCDSFFS